MALIDDTGGYGDEPMKESKKDMTVEEFRNKLNKLDTRVLYDNWAVKDFIDCGITPEQVVAYQKVCDSYNRPHNIISLAMAGVPPEKVTQYYAHGKIIDIKFDGPTIATLYSYGVSPEDSQRLPSKIEGGFVADLLHRGATIDEIVEEAQVEYEINPALITKVKENRETNPLRDRVDDKFGNDTRKRFRRDGPEYLKENGKDIEYAKRFHPRFDDDEIIELVTARISPEIANQYHRLFYADSIIELWNNNVFANAANRYKTKGGRVHDSHIILKMIKQGITPEYRFPGIGLGGIPAQKDNKKLKPNEKSRADELVDGNATATPVDNRIDEIVDNTPSIKIIAATKNENELESAIAAIEKGESFTYKGRAYMVIPQLEKK